jgi:ATP-dependent helicase/nuclease subunit B
MLLGPAGSGKTFRCLAEIRSELARSPESPELIFLAPKQATFQLERQLLDSADLAGYSRLRIFSFQRLARHIFDVCGVPVPKLLGAEGRVMVLRALLGSLHEEFTIFRTCARRIGFAEEAGDQIREFQQHGLTPDKLRQIAVGSPEGPSRQKLLDLALLLERYARWLREHGLQDEENLLSLAADLLAKNPGSLRLAGVWFDGFAQLTPQERGLLLALLREAGRALLAFCLGAPSADRFSPWQIVAKTFRAVRADLATQFGAEALEIETLPRGPGRFGSAPPLAHLEAAWGSSAVFPGAADSIALVRCADPEAEVVACARALVRHVRNGGRFRDAAVLLRHFDNDFPHLIRRVFARYGVPFFLDHRERVAHHPLAELTRGALRMLVFHWKHQDCFCVFKSGLLTVRAEVLDQLENLALEHGWEGQVWREGFRLRNNPQLEAEANACRKKLIEPFVRLAAALGERPGGAELAEGLRRLWADCNAEEQLENWSFEEDQPVHATVWEQMCAWLENFELAFAGQRMPLRDWLAIVEAGLSGLTVGAVPPVLDQVLVGTVDRSRNPDLKLMFVLGLNEGVFPAIPPHRPLLNEQDRSRLLDHGIELANLSEQQVSLEQFYGYIACTRAREQLVLSWSETSADGSALNESRFVGQIRQMFPAVAVRMEGKPQSWQEAEHACELHALAAGLPAELRARARMLPEPSRSESLDPAVVRRLYGRELTVSVSAMERYAMCPFRFFVEQGLKVRERQEFSLDVREQGSFQHEVLSRYHERLCAMSKRWRDLAPTEASELIGQIADELMTTFKDGLLLANEQNRFTGENYKASLQEFIAVVTEWFGSNEFDPAVVELPFGTDEDSLPGWRLEVPGGALVLRGRVDRADLLKLGDGTALCAVFDYKSGLTKPDQVLMEHGVQQQLPAYLLALCRIPGAAVKLGVAALRPAGCFYVPLGARHDSEDTRDDALADIELSRRTAHQHAGVFDHQHIGSFDKVYQGEGSAQFKYTLKQDHQPKANGFNALQPARFAEVLGKLEENLRTFAGDIFEGRIAIRPFKKGGETGCDRCKNQSICRFDPWAQEYRVLKKSGKAEE